MNVLVIGNGGREHALVWKISQSPKVNKIYAVPGNAGIGEIAELVNIRLEDIETLVQFTKANSIDLTVVGPEAPLVKGIVDRFEEEGLRIVGPNKEASRLEGSKSFAKNFMIRHNISTAKYKEYTDVDEAINEIDLFGFPVVIKADGLAAGKGVIIANDREEAIDGLNMIMKERKFGEAGSKVVIEEFLDGIEASVLCFVDGDTIIPMVSAQDYKKAYDDDKGPNTGGMGTYSPSGIYDNEMEKKVKDTILDPIIEGIKKDGLKYKGILFIGLMIADGFPKVLEFNVRFGDPETQVILPRLRTDIIEVFEGILEKRLKDIEIEWSNKSSICVVLASGGYPEKYEKGKIINSLDQLEDVLVFHAGTKYKDGNIVTNGGRVLGIATLEDSLEQAREKAYMNVNKVSFEGKQYRTDIGK